jgi:hypothetical protein
MKPFLKYSLIALLAQAFFFVFTLATGIGGWLGFVLYMLPYAFLGVLTGRVNEAGQETSLPMFALLMLIPAIIYSILAGLGGLLISRLESKVK